MRPGAARHVSEIKVKWLRGRIYNVYDVSTYVATRVLDTI